MKVITTNLLNYFWKKGILPIKTAVEGKLDASRVANNLSTTAEGYVLDARQGKTLNDEKLNKTNVANNLTTTAAGYAMDARQGKILNDGKLNKTNVLNNLTTTASGNALDARQGKALNDKITTLNNNLNANIGILDTTVTTDQNGSATIPLLSGYSHLLCVTSNSWQYLVFRQGDTLRVYTAGGGVMAAVANTSVPVRVVLAKTASYSSK